MVWGFPGVLDRPIVADIDQDGIDDLGLWVPRDSASLPQEVAEWYFLMSDTPAVPVTFDLTLGQTAPTTTSFFATNLRGNTTIAPGQFIRFLSGANAGEVRTVVAFSSGTGELAFTAALATAPAAGDIVAIGGVANEIVTLDHAFSPVPFGNDIFAEFGDELALPIIGNFDPPTTSTTFAPDTGVPGDYDNSGGVSGGDYNAWRANFGSTTALANGNGDSTTDAADYVLWRKFSGSVSGGAGTQPSSATSNLKSALAGSTALAIESAALDVEPQPEPVQAGVSGVWTMIDTFGLRTESKLAIGTTRSPMTIPAISDLLLADLRLEHLDHVDARIELDFDIPWRSADDWPQHVQSEHDMALEIAWDELHLTPRASRGGQNS
jgi:hypothetical protein